MRKEIENWMRTAEDDFKTAEYDFKGRKFSPAAFWCQQAVEKALKARFLHENRAEFPKTHSLIYLAKRTHVPKRFFPFLRELTPAFIDTRYPDGSVEYQSVIYDKEDTIRMMRKSKEVLEWIKNQF